MMRFLTRKKSPSPAATQSMLAHIRRTWLRLTEEEVVAYGRDYTKFIAAVRQQYGLTQEEIEKQLSQWERGSRLAA